MICSYHEWTVNRMISIFKLYEYEKQQFNEIKEYDERKGSRVYSRKKMVGLSSTRVPFFLQHRVDVVQTHIYRVSLRFVSIFPQYISCIKKKKKFGLICEIQGVKLTKKIYFFIHIFQKTFHCMTSNLEYYFFLR